MGEIGEDMAGIRYWKNDAEMLGQSMMPEWKRKRPESAPEERNDD